MYEGPHKCSHLLKVATFCGKECIVATFCGVLHFWLKPGPTTIKQVRFPHIGPQKPNVATMENISPITMSTLATVIIIDMSIVINDSNATSIFSTVLLKDKAAMPQATSVTPRTYKDKMY